MQQADDGFADFYAEQAPAVRALALRHGGDADACVRAVFSELSDHWGRVRDPLRFTRRAAVLFVCRGRRRPTRAAVAPAHRALAPR